jgi:hypothetical protein
MFLQRVSSATGGSELGGRGGSGCTGDDGIPGSVDDIRESPMYTGREDTLFDYDGHIRSDADEDEDEEQRSEDEGEEEEADAQDDEQGHGVYVWCH